MKPQLTLEAFADWCEKQPAQNRYSYCMATRCAMTQFVRSIGFDIEKVLTPNIGEAYFLVQGRRVNLPGAFEIAVNDDDMTFGALAARLRAAQ